MHRHAIIYPGQTGLLIRDGRIDRTLAEGRHSWWDWSGTRAHVLIAPTTPQLVGVYQIELMTADHFSFRINVAVHARLADAATYYASLGSSMREYLTLAGPLLNYGQVATYVAAAWRDAVSKRTLEEFLADPQADADTVGAALAPALPGGELTGMAITQITMPPEIRKMFTEVERARREGLAQLERARSEQAALRALANAARSLVDNPGLERLRMLQTMESAKGNKTFVLGDGIGQGIAIK